MIALAIIIAVSVVIFNYFIFTNDMKYRGYFAESSKWLVAIVIFGSVAIIFHFEGKQEWQEFSEKHECKLVEKTAATWLLGFEKSVYKCNDGVTYTR